MTHIDPDGQFAILIPIAISLVAEYTIPFAAIALQEAGYITAAAFITGVVQGYNGSVLEGSPLEGLDANTAIAGNAGKALGLALCCANPRKGITNVARTAVAKEASVAATTVAAKAANKWSTAVVKQAPREAARKTNQIAQKSVVQDSKISLDALSKAGEAVDRGGLTKAGRALEKHGNRSGSFFPKATGNIANKNAQGQFILDDILTHPNSYRTKVFHKKFGEAIYIRVPKQRGVQFTTEGEFIGFMEP